MVHYDGPTQIYLFDLFGTPAGGATETIVDPSPAVDGVPPALPRGRCSARSAARKSEDAMQSMLYLYVPDCAQAEHQVGVADRQVSVPDGAVLALHLVDRRDVVEAPANEVEVIV